MFRNPYDTTVGMLMGLSYQNLVDKILLFAAAHREQIGGASMDGISDQWRVKSITPGLGALPPFAHPVCIEDNSGSKEWIRTGWDNDVYIDVRNFTRLSQTKEVVISSEGDYNFTVLRGHLQRRWMLKDGYLDILTLGSFPTSMFTRCISSLLTRRLALAPDIQMRVTVILAYFYLCMFKEVDKSESVTLTERELLEMSRMITAATFVSATDVIDIIRDIPIMRDLKDLVKVFKDDSNSIRFENFEVATLLELVGTMWAGSNYREIAQVAMEHPPTWVAMVYTAVKQRGFANAYLSRIVKDYSRGTDDESFAKNVLFLFK